MWLRFSKKDLRVFEEIKWFAELREIAGRLKQPHNSDCKLHRQSQEVLS